MNILVWRTSGGTTNRSFAYSFNAASMITNVSRENGGWTAYAYDSLDRLLSEKQYASTGVTSSASWNYDLAGNRTLAVTNGVTNLYSYAAGNILTNFGSGTLVQHDSAGNITNLQYNASRKLGLYWNGRYELTEVRTNGVTVEKYDYDPLGRRARIIAGATTNTFVYSGPHIVAEWSNNVLARSYAYGPQIDDIRSMTTYGAATNTYYYLKDKIGSVHALVNTNGTVVEQYKYTAWGDVTVLSSNGTVLASSSYGNRFTWQGREVSYSTGLMFFRSRYYSAPLGRWLSKDKIGISGGANLYEAFGNNSVNFTDPMGCRWGISEFGGLNTASKTGIAGIISAGVAGYLQFSVDMQGLFLKENALRAEIDSNRSTMSMLQNVIDSMGEANWGDGFGQVGLLGANLVPQGDVCKDRQSVRNLFESVRNTRGWGTAVQEGLTRLVTAGYNPEALPRNMHPRMRAELAKALLERQQAYNEFLVMQLNLR